MESLFEVKLHQCLVCTQTDTLGIGDLDDNYWLVMCEACDTMYQLSKKKFNLNKVYLTFAENVPARGKEWSEYFYN